MDPDRQSGFINEVTGNILKCSYFMQSERETQRLMSYSYQVRQNTGEFSTANPIALCRFFDYCIHPAPYGD